MNMQNYDDESQQIKVGLIPSPELPTLLANKLSNELTAYFTQFITSEVDWQIEIYQDPLIGAAENVREIMQESVEIREKKEWDYALCLTDLPLYDGDDVILADADFKHGVAQISVPAFGSMPIRPRVRKVVVQLVKELFYKGLEDSSGETAATRENRNLGRRKKSLIRRQFPFSSIQRDHSSSFEDTADLHFIIRPRLQARLRVLFGMAYANRPLTIMPSFKPVVAVAFATGAYGLIFPTLWKISAFLEMPRFMGLMVASIFSIVLWIIVSHGLWENPTTENQPRIRRMYNEATILTLLIAVSFYYLALYVLFLFMILLFISPHLFGMMTTMQSEINFGNYLKLAWLATSIATLAGSIGAGLENDEMVKNITYGYRQRVRFNTMKQQRKYEENEPDQ